MYWREMYLRALASIGTKFDDDLPRPDPEPAPIKEPDDPVPMWAKDDEDDTVELIVFSTGRKLRAKKTEVL